MNTKRLGKHWCQSMGDALVRIRTLKVRTSLNAEAVHSLRIALRRTRLLLLIGRPCFDSSSARAFRRDARQLLTALSPVRDCDVALTWLSQRRTSNVVKCQLRQLRQHHWQRARRRFQRRFPLLPPPSKPQNPDALTRRWEKWLSITKFRCNRLLDRHTTLSSEELHELRRHIRRLRYLMELHVHQRRSSEAAEVRQLADWQESLGKAQNYIAIREALRHLPASTEVRRWQKTAHDCHNRARRYASNAAARRRMIALTSLP